MKNEVTFRSARYSGVPDRRGPPLWHELFPAEQARVLQLLVERWIDFEAAVYTAEHTAEAAEMVAAAS